MNIKGRVVAALVRLYPVSWRAEYGEELGSLLLVHALNLSVFADVALSAAREHLRSGPVWKPFGAALFAWTCLGIFVNNTVAPSHEYCAWYEHLWELIVLLAGCCTALSNRGDSPARAAAKAALIGFTPELVALTLWAAGIFHPLVTKAASSFPLLESRLALFDMTFPTTPNPGFAMIPFAPGIVVLHASVIGFIGGQLARVVSFLSRRLRLS